jgi:hypothetical protein
MPAQGARRNPEFEQNEVTAIRYADTEPDLHDEWQSYMVTAGSDAGIVLQVGQFVSSEKVVGKIRPSAYDAILRLFMTLVIFDWDR